MIYFWIVLLGVSLSLLAHALAQLYGCFPVKYNHDKHLLQLAKEQEAMSKRKINFASDMGDFFSVEFKRGISAWLPDAPDTKQLVIEHIKTLIREEVRFQLALDMQSQQIKKGKLK